MRRLHLLVIWDSSNLLLLIEIIAAKLFSTIHFKNEVETIDITKKQLTATNLREAKILCEDSDKDGQLYYLLQVYPYYGYSQMQV